MRAENAFETSRSNLRSLGHRCPMISAQISFGNGVGARQDSRADFVVVLESRLAIEQRCGVASGGILGSVEAGS